MRQLTSVDAQFLAVESPRTYGHVSGLAVYDPSTAPGGEVTLKDICRLVGERLHLLPPFRWKLVEVPFGLDHPYWIEDPDFDLDFHIRESAVPPPGGPKQLAETVSRIVARPLDRNHPLWELYLVQGLEGGRVAMLTKIHHSVVDGVSGAEILGILLDTEPEGREVPPPEDDDCGEREPGQIEMLGRGLLGIPRQPLRAVRSLPSALPWLEDVPTVSWIPGVGTASRLTGRVLGRSTADGDVIERQATRAPRTRFNGRISPHRRFAFGSLSLDKVKAMKNQLGITVNDVVVGLCATALREWLIEHDELPDEPLVAMVPVSVRSEDQMGTFGNRISMMLVPIPTDEEDPHRRLMRAHEVMKVAKTRHKATPANLLQDVNHFIPPALLARAARVTAQMAGIERARPPLNLVISNVPGPQFPLYCAGAQMVAQYPVSVIMDGAGLNITVMSYMGHLDFGIVMDREQVDDAWPLMGKLSEAMDELDQVICGTKPKPARSRTTA